MKTITIVCSLFLAMTSASAETTQPNFLILVADDLGVDSIGLYGENSRNVNTPNLDELAAQGMRFSQFWSQPACSPMRASTLTGRYSFRHGVGGPLFFADPTVYGVPIPEVPAGTPKELDYTPLGAVDPANATSGLSRLSPRPGLNSDELLLPAVLKSLSQPYATAAFGKWHLADRENGLLRHPNNAGFDHFSGPIDGVVPSFYAWPHVENGEPSQQFGYVDQTSVDNALEWINAQDGDKPWFVWFSFINPHEPFHVPPKELIQSDELRNLNEHYLTHDNIPQYFQAMVEAMDSHVGQILAGIPEDVRKNTYVIWLGDNGDDRWARDQKDINSQRFKMSTYEGGVNVPFIATGPGIPAGSVNPALAHVVDLFGTVIELAGGDVGEATQGRTIDSHSLAGQLLAKDGAPQRSWVYTDIDIPGIPQGQMSAVRNAEYKLVRKRQGDEFYYIAKDPDEQHNLIENMDQHAEENYQALKSQLDELLAGN